MRRRRIQQRIQQQIQQRQRHIRYRWLGIILSLMMILLSGSMAWGQVPSSAVEALPSPLRTLDEDLPVLRDILNDNDAGVARGVVWLDGRRLFTIAVPVLQEGQTQQETDLTPVESRVRIIEQRLQQIVERGFEPDSLEVTSETDANSRQPVIYVQYQPLDQNTEQSETTEQLLTVTALDAQINGTETETWAGQITEIVQNALTTAQLERQPEELRERGLWAGGILFLIGILSWSLTRWQRQLRTERQNLSEQFQTDKTQLSMTATNPDSPESTTALLQRRAKNQQRQGVNDIKRRLSQLAQLLLWGVGLFVIFGLFPYTRWLQPLMVRWVQIPIRLLLLVLFIYLAIRFSDIVIDRLFWALQGSTSLASNTSQRLMLRFNTFSRVTKSIAVLVWGIIGILLAVSALGIAVSPALLTVAGIIGVGISLASQNLIKDIINGFLILLEDQYGVGDVISIGEISGFVENMNLRITQLRNTEGHLITIPNSSITVVQNLSKEWSRVDLSVSVAYEADLDQAIAVTEAVAQQMSRDPEWQELILETPEVLGVDNLDYAGATIRLWIKTQPLRQWEVAREYRRRLKLAFDAAGISIGIPQQSLWLSSPEDHLPQRQPHSSGFKQDDRRVDSVKPSQ